MSYKQILESLYSRYYINRAQHSAVTSSHWQIIGKHKVQKHNDNFTMKGFAFGSFRDNTLFNKLKCIIESYNTHKIVTQYQCDPQIYKISKQVAKASNRIYDFDCAKQALSLTHIKSSLPKEYEELNGKTIAIIGDGYGFMGNLIKMIFPHSKIIFINLGKTLLFDCYYTSLIHPTLQAALLSPSSQEMSPDFNFLEAEQYHLLQLIPVDLFINIASMQEMNNSVINKYFDYIQQSPTKSKLFYCCNRIEKKLPDGEVTKVKDYPWKGWKIIHKELCPWYTKYPINRPPFFLPFDGPTIHILAKYEDI